MLNTDAIHLGLLEIIGTYLLVEFLNSSLAKIYKHMKCQEMKGILPDLELPPTQLPLFFFPPWFTALIIK